MPTKLLIFLTGLCVAALTAAGAAPAAERVVRDATGRDVTIGSARRVISIGGSLTEIIYALGLEDRVIAVDTTSLFPPQAASKPKVGYMRTLSAEGVLAMRPELILALEGAGPPETLDVLKDASVPVVIVPDRYTPDGIVEKIRLVAMIFSVEADGERLAARTTAALRSVEAGLAGLAEKKRVLFILSLAGGRPLAAGTSTAANSMIALAGARNALSGFEGYKPVSDEAIATAAPDAVLVMDNGPQKMTADEVFGLPAFRLTPAARTRNLISMDGLYLLSFGPRTAAATRDLAERLYPDLRLPAEAPPVPAP